MTKTESIKQTFTNIQKFEKALKNLKFV